MAASRPSVRASTVTTPSTADQAPDVATSHRGECTSGRATRPHGEGEHEEHAMGHEAEQDRAPGDPRTEQEQRGPGLTERQFLRWVCGSRPPVGDLTTGPDPVPPGGGADAAPGESVDHTGRVPRQRAGETGDAAQPGAVAAMPAEAEPRDARPAEAEPRGGRPAEAEPRVSGPVEAESRVAGSREIERDARSTDGESQDGDQADAATCRTDRPGWAGGHRHGAVRPRPRTSRRQRPPGRWC